MHPYLRRRNGEEEVTYIHPLTKPCLEEDARRAAVPGTAHAARGRLRGVQRGRGRPAAPGDGLEAQPGAHGTDARAAHGGHGRARHHRRHRGGDLHEAGGVLELRFPREPLGELRLPRLFELVDQVPLPGRVRGVAVERAADGVLLAALDRARRAPPRRAGARPRPQRVAPRRHARTAHRSTSTRSADRCAASTPSRRTSRCGSACAACAACTTRCSTASTTNAWSAPFTDLEDFVRRTGATVDQVEALATAGAFEAVLRPVAPGRVVGRGRARNRPARTRAATARSSRRCPASSPAPTRPRCRA